MIHSLDESVGRLLERPEKLVALMVGFAFLGCWLIGLGSLLFGGVPPKRSIVEHPFW